MDDLVVGNGLISLLEALSIAVLDPGDTVLVPTPVFPGLVTALTYRTQASFVPMEIGSESDFQLNPNALQQRLQSEMDQGRNVKAVLLCSPGNPVGQVFTADQIREFVSVAERFGVALIVDEIYASSCFTGVDFFSATSVDSENVFVIGGLSKDFGLAGYATGWIHTRNHRILAALKKQSHYFRLSAPIQTAVVQFLEPQWQTEFSKTNREKLTEGYRYVCDQLSESGVDVVPAQAGLVLWLDMRSFLKSETEQGQFDLYQNLLDEHRVHLSPGAGFHFSDPGYFRICFSQQQETLREGLRRLKQGLQQYQTAQLNRHVEV